MLQMSPSKQCAHPRSFPQSASSHSHRSPLACHSLSSQSFSFCTWPVVVWRSLLHMNNNIWLFRQKPSDSAVSTVIYRLISFLSLLFFSFVVLRIRSSTVPFLLSFCLSPLLVLRVLVHVIHFSPLSHSSNSLSLSLCLCVLYVYIVS